MDSRIDPQTGRPVVAMVYDVDGTLIEGNMQDGYLRSFGIQPDDFWQQTNQRAQAEDASYIETYMRMLLEVASCSRAWRSGSTYLTGWATSSTSP